MSLVEKLQKNSKNIKKLIKKIDERCFTLYSSLTKLIKLYNSSSRRRENQNNVIFIYWSKM